MVEIVEFDAQHYDESLALWEMSEGIVVRAVDAREPLYRYLERNPGLSFVAIDGSNVVGTVLCGTDGRRGYLHHLAVAHNMRRQGIGRRLANTAIAALKSQGVLKCHLFVVNDNDAASAFWQSMEWQRRDDIAMYSHGNG